MNTKVTGEDVEKALMSLEAQLASGDETVSKASEDDLDQPEGADMGNQAKDKMSDAAKAKKAMKKGDLKIEHEDDDEGEDEGEDMELEKKKAYQKAKKSFSDEMPEEIETKIDVSNFLKSLVDHTGNTIDALREYVAKSDIAQGARYEELEMAVSDIQKSQAKIGIVLKAICQQIGVIKAQPAHTGKAQTVVKSEAQTERKFSSGLEGEADEGKLFKSLSETPSIAKSQISNAICELVKKGEATDMDVIGFESGNYIRPELVTKLKTVI
jgi:hypothetical protein